MKQIYKDYVACLNSFVQNTKPVIEEKVDYPQLIQLAKINSTEGIVNYVLLNNPDLVESQFHGYMRKQCYNEIAMYSRRAEQMKALVNQLDEEGIDHLLFKGFVVREYFTVPELRTFGDIDFVIRKDDRQKCDALMKQLDYEPRDDWEPVYTYLKGIEYYEIHTDVMEIDVSDKADYKAYYSHIWEHSVPSTLMGTPHSYEFTPEFHFVYMLTHIAKHISNSGAGIRMYLDIAFFIKNFDNSIDWNWISIELKKLKFEDFSNIILTAVEQWFGVKSPLPLKPIIDEVMDDFLTFTIEGGVYGKIGRDESVVFLKQQNRNEAEISRFKTMMFHIFPPISSMENRYSYLQQHHWLLPVAWIHRILGNRASWKRYARNAKGIVTANTDEAKRLKKMYKEIGL